MINVHGFRFNPQTNPDISSSDRDDGEGDSYFFEPIFSNVYVDGSGQSRSIRLKYRSSSRDLIKGIIEIPK